MPCFPVFCTTKIPADILNQLCELREQWGANFDNEDRDLYFVTPLDDKQQLLEKDTVHEPVSQDLAIINPFTDWTVQECYSFYKTWLQDSPDRKVSSFTAFTFLILDRDSLATYQKHRCYTALVCTDVPDVADIPKHQHQEERRPILKVRRLAFEAAVQTLDSWEMMTGMPSDLGQSEQLSFHAESWFEHLEYTDTGEIKKFVSAETARAKQERLLWEYANGERKVDVTKD